jgi:hypothetical protein
MGMDNETGRSGVRAVRKWHLFTILIVLVIGMCLVSGCISRPKASGVAGTPVIPAGPGPVTTVITITPRMGTPAPAAPVIRHTVTGGFWCRDNLMTVGTALTSVRECYQFFPDGTYKWGYSPGWPMGKSPGCPGDPAAECEYSVNAKGQYEVQGGYAFTLYGDTLTNPRDNPPFVWSSAGIP